MCVTSSITMKSQAASSTALVNYSKILPPKCTIDSFDKYINNDPKKLEMFFRLVFFKYSMLLVCIGSYLNQFLNINF